MAQHRARQSAPRWLPPAAAVLTLLVVFVAGALIVRESRDGATPGSLASAPPCDRTMRVVTASSFRPVLDRLAPALSRGGDCLRLAVETVDGRAAPEAVARTGADVWIPDDVSWTASAGVAKLAKAPEAAAGTVLATSPIYMVTDETTAQRLREAGGSWLGLARLVAQPDGPRLAVRDPASSGDGMVGIGSVAEAVWLDRDMDASALWLARAKEATRTVSGLAPAMPERPGEVGLVPEYALLGAPPTAGPTTVLAGADHTALLRYSWQPTATAVSDPARAASLQRLLGELLAPAGAAAIVATHLRVVADATASEGSPAPGASGAPDPSSAPDDPAAPGGSVAPDAPAGPAGSAAPPEQAPPAGAGGAAGTSPGPAANLVPAESAVPAGSAPPVVPGGSGAPGQSGAPAGPGGSAAPAVPGDATVPLPELAAKPFRPLKAHHVDHVFAAWYAADRRTSLLVVVDISGSMADPAPGTKTPLIELVKQGCRSVVGLLPDDAQVGLWEFGVKLTGSSDHRSLVQMAPLAAGQRAAWSGAVDRLSARRTGTGLNDTILSAYTTARDNYREGVPNQVLILTDGRDEDDPDGLSTARLATSLAKAEDPTRPVQLSVATFGQREEAERLEQALKPIDGYLDRLDTADEVAAVFIHAAAGGLHPS
ncbi:MAG TPA: substrate-binding domain-containing protein [Catenuloplanes sp.]|jgi:hypothetical protein